MADARVSRSGDAQQSDGEPACRTGDPLQPPPAHRMRAFHARKGPGVPISLSQQYRRLRQAPRILLTQLTNYLRTTGQYSEKELARLYASTGAMTTDTVKLLQVPRKKLRTRCYVRAQQHRLQHSLDTMNHEWMLGLSNANVSYRNYECMVKRFNERFGHNRCYVSVKGTKTKRISSK